MRVLVAYHDYVSKEDVEEWFNFHALPRCGEYITLDDRYYLVEKVYHRPLYETIKIMLTDVTAPNA